MLLVLTPPFSPSLLLNPFFLWLQDKHELNGMASIPFSFYSYLDTKSPHSSPLWPFLSSVLSLVVLVLGLSEQSSSDPIKANF